MIYLRTRELFMPFLELARPLALMLFLFYAFAENEVHAATASTPIDDIRSAALDQARRSVDAPDAQFAVGRIDERLRLAACPAPLSTRTASDSASALSIEVRCDAAGWKLFVPVSVRVQVPVLVAARPLARGEPVKAADVQVQMRERAGLGTAWIGTLDQLDGRVLGRAVSAGSVLTPAQFAAGRLVRRGQSVVLVAVSGGFQVRSQGKALGDAGAGERVRVESSSSRRVVEGQVQADGSVVVSL
jgi:flagellar basal body P-ring formation protein FlgA